VNLRTIVFTTRLICFAVIGLILFESGAAWASAGAKPRSSKPTTQIQQPQAPSYAQAMMQRQAARSYGSSAAAPAGAQNSYPPNYNASFAGGQPMPMTGAYQNTAANYTQAYGPAQPAGGEHGYGYAPSGYAPPTRLKVSEYQFLIELGRNLSKVDAAITNQVYRVVEQLKQQPTLSPENYDFLNKLAQGVKSPQIAGFIQQIAEEHHPV
jgi:hypothetical protein